MLCSMTAIRHHTTVAEAGHLLFANGERHLRPLDALAEHYPDWLLAESVRIARRCTFDFEQLKYEYPHELVPKGQTATSWLRELTERGIRRRWPKGLSAAARAQVEKELALITEKKFDSYFLTVHDIVEFARSQHILCQGRGSAANSAVCYALGITELNPEKSNLLFERFISKERNEPPDIDVDFEHDRREEVIQYIFRRYGRGRAALTAVASTYHGSGAMRLREYGFDADTPILKRVLALTGELIGFPRHLSQHPGGFVHPLDTLVPVENAAMAERTIIQWDKETSSPWACSARCAGRSIWCICIAASDGPWPICQVMIQKPTK